jgi:poly-beta-hydroxybutyrate-responsive repressor
MPEQRQRRRWSRSRGGVWFLEPTLLLLLHHGSVHGYLLGEQLVQFGLADLHASVVYRTLRDMEERNWVTSYWDTDNAQGPPRRVYQLTATGDDVLRVYIEDLEQTHAQIGRLIAAYHRHMDEGEGEHH